MSDQPPLASPSGPDPSFRPYDAPAWGEAVGEPDPGQAPTQPAPVTPAAPPAYDTPAYGVPAYGAPAVPPPPGAASETAAWSPYPVAPQGQDAYALHQQYVAYHAPTHQLATTSLVLGIISIAGVALTPVFLVTFLSALCSPFAIWLGIRARREIRADPRRYGGQGLATAGLVTGIIGLVLAIMGLLLILALLAFFAAIVSSAG